MDDLEVVNPDLSEALSDAAKNHVKDMGLADEDTKADESNPDLEENAPDSKTDVGDDDTIDEEKADEIKDEALDEKTLADIKAGKLIPQYRFNEVLQQLQAYKAFGSPEDLRKSLERVQAAKAEGPEAEEELSDKDKEVKAYIEKMFPQFKKLSDVESEIERIRAERAQSTNTFIESVEKKVDEYATKELGIDTKKPLYTKIMRNIVADIIHENPDYKRRFYEGKDMGVVEDAKAELNKFLSGIRRQTKAEIVGGKKKTALLPKPIGKGGIPPAGNPPKPESKDVDLDAVGRSAWEKFQAKAVGE